VYPPLTEIIWPVTWGAADGDANQSTARATSSAVVATREPVTMISGAGEAVGVPALAASSIQSNGVSRYVGIALV
jgi:hypothetical protein